DIVFHADIVGAAFTVIKAEGKEVPNETVKEAAEFSAANSKAWAKGLGKISVFCLPREKYVKEAGMAKGTFGARGERMWFRDLELKVAIGVKVEEEAIVVYGPVMSVRKNSEYFVTIKPGFKKSLELARDIKNRIMIKARPEDKYKIDAIPMEDFEKAIPGGMGDVVEFS
ncbi:MAG: NFACT RNA binding domain-containing protein, partial [Candidatus Aenigmarchaeota archaeon]